MSMPEEDEWIVDGPLGLAAAKGDVREAAAAVESILKSYALPRDVNDCVVDAWRLLVKARDAL